MKSAATTASVNSINKLEEAFDMFNQVSAELGSNYRTLESKVVGLSQELAASNSARIKELTEKEELAAKLSALMDALPGGVVVLDEHGIVQEENPVAQQLLGQSYRHTPWSEVLGNIAVGSSSFDGEVSLKEGKRISITRSPFGDSGNIILLLTDISENYRLSNLINREKRLAALGEMAARLAHQVRTPLSSAILYLSNLSSMAKTMDQQSVETVANIQSRLRQIEKLVDGMLSYIRGDISSKQTFSGASLLHEAKEANALLLKAGRGILTIEVPDSDIDVNGDKEALFNALSNLIENSIQAVESEPAITLSLDRDEKFIYFRIKDNGPGIDEAIRENIFDPFYSTRVGGTGLGLAVVLSAVKAHKGKISVDCPKGGGSVFTLSIPLDKNAGNENAAGVEKSVEEFGIWM